MAIGCARVLIVLPCALPHAVYMQRDEDDFEAYGKILARTIFFHVCYNTAFDCARAKLVFFFSRHTIIPRMLKLLICNVSCRRGSTILA
jgi:hypothetical protein